MTNKRLCDLPTCTRQFKPKAVQQRFCCVKHRHKFHQQERLRLIRLAREKERHEP